MSEPDPYAGREQTKIKHLILRKYLERLALIVGGSFAKSITYVDCFSGPWNVRSEVLSDSSFAIALEELRKARTALARRQKTLSLRCMFLEKKREAYARLEEFAKQVPDAEIETKNAMLEDSVDDILRFIRKGEGRTFPFIFIDPTGWKGFAMNVIAPLLRLDPGEALINFMTDYVRRFIDHHPNQPTREQFADLFGSGDYKATIQGLRDARDREDALITAYAENVRRTGSFAHVCAAVVLYPESERTYFHLIYATRHRKGVEVFKQVEKEAVGAMARERGTAQQRKRIKKTGQRELFSGEEMSESSALEALRSRYLREAKRQVLEVLETSRRVPYEHAWDTALSYPLVWESDLKEWIADWQLQENLRIDGMRPRQRVPHLDERNVLIWRTSGPRTGGSR